ncbi:hypothetical protein HYY72_05510 [Candidatus Woesearchaeota archaeon]|nr:hypothetical protein [Candidatus Woesearchaeota archaeon]
MGKRGYFFTLDAFVAMGIIVIGLVMILTSNYYSPVTVQPIALSNDVILSLSSTKVTEANNNYTLNLVLNGSITNKDNSLLQQAGEFYVNNQRSMSSNFVRNVTYSLVPQQYSFNVSINRTTIYNRGSLAKSSRLVVSTKSIVFGVYNDTMWGPYPAEVSVWQ